MAPRWGRLASRTPSSEYGKGNALKPSWVHPVADRLADKPAVITGWADGSPAGSPDHSTEVFMSSWRWVWYECNTLKPPIGDDILAFDWILLIESALRAR